MSGHVLITNSTVKSQIVVTNTNQILYPNDNGYFNIGKLDAGVYYLNIYAPGYTHIKDTIEIKNENIYNLLYKLKRKYK